MAILARHAPTPLFVAVFALAGCGSKTDPGTGTQTLYAQIEVEGRPDSTRIEVELKARGNPVIGANVVFRDVERDTSATAEATRAGSYRATLSGYAVVLQVAVTSGEDRLEAQLEGPRPHVITRPPNNAIVRRRDFDTLKVEWEADNDADRVIVEVEDADPIEVEGGASGTEIPLDALENGEQRLRVTRENRVELAGGTTGSQMTTQYTVDNRFTLEG